MYWKPCHDIYLNNNSLTQTKIAAGFDWARASLKHARLVMGIGGLTPSRLHGMWVKPNRTAWLEKGTHFFQKFQPSCCDWLLVFSCTKLHVFSGPHPPDFILDSLSASQSAHPWPRAAPANDAAPRRSHASTRHALHRIPEEGHCRPGHPEGRCLPSAHRPQRCKDVQNHHDVKNHCKVFGSVGMCCFLFFFPYLLCKDSTSDADGLA